MPGWVAAVHRDRPCWPHSNSTHKTLDFVKKGGYLSQTLRAKFTKDVSDVEIDSVFRVLVKRGYVKPEGAKITYALPEE